MFNDIPDHKGFEIVAVFKHGMNDKVTTSLLETAQSVVAAGFGQSMYTNHIYIRNLETGRFSPLK